MPYVFEATHGVTFADTDRKRRPDGGWDETYDVWADFKPTDPLLVNGVAVKRYRMETSDSKIAARLRKVDDYGITEVKADKEPTPSKEPENPAPEPPK